MGTTFYGMIGTLSTFLKVYILFIYGVIEHNNEQLNRKNQALWLLSVNVENLYWKSKYILIVLFEINMVTYSDITAAHYFTPEYKNNSQLIFQDI